MVISEILRNPDNYLWSDALFAGPSRPIALETACVVHDADDVEDEQLDLPDKVIALGYDYVIDIQTLQSVIANAKLQGHDTLRDRLTALNFYLENDAFIVFYSAQ